MARTLSRTFGHSGPRLSNERRLRSPCVRAAVVDAPNAVPEELEAQTDEHESMYAQFDELLKGTVTSFKAGTEVRGTIVDVSRKGAYVDIGGKGAAFAATQNLCIAPIVDANEILRPGMVRDFTITHFKKEMVQLSMAVHERAIQWQRLRTMQEEDITVPGTVISANRGGVMVRVFNCSTGFVPNSHLGPVGDKESIIGNDLKLKFLEVDERNDKLLLSAKRVRSADSIASYRVGDVVEAVVTQVAPFGAFLELEDGISGLLHISQVSHDRVTDMEKLVNIGDRMKVMVMSHDRERDRLALSTKKLEPTPGDMLKDPSIVFQRADEMAALFKIRVAAAEQAARETEQSVASTSEGATDAEAQPAAAGEDGKLW